MADTVFSWVKPTSFDDFVGQGILAGEENGNKVYVGRTVDHDGNFVAAKIVPALESAFYVFNGVEESSDEVERLDNVADYHWTKSNVANLEDAVFVSGSYVGRGTYNGSIVVGTVDSKTNQLVGSLEGKLVSLPSFDVLIHKQKGVVYEAIQKASNSSMFKSNEFLGDRAYSMRTVVNDDNTFLNDSGFSMKTVTNGVTNGETRYESKYEYTYMSLMSKIRQLEMEKSSYRRDKQGYEERLEFEQRKVAELSHQVKALRVENARFSKERFSYEEKFTLEQSKFSELEVKVRGYSLNNSYLMKKINNLEEAIRYEKLLVESLSERYNSSTIYSKTLLTKLTNFEESIKTQQQRIFELESEIMITTSSSESLSKKITDYEETVKYLRLQMETYNKKLEISFSDNEFLVQKLSMLNQTLRTYYTQLECLTNKLQSSKTVIATAHSDLSRTNAQISKYQAALSSCYTVNGELITKVSGLTAVAQNQIGSDCSLHLVNHNAGVTFGNSFKSFGYGKTSTLMEMTGSDSYMSSMSSAEEAQAEETRAYDGNFNPIPVPTPAGVPTTNGSSYGLDA